MRWLYHVVRTAELPTVPNRDYAPASLATEGFVHCSYQPLVRESAELYFRGGEALSVLRIDPRRLDVNVDVASTPRGPMPHVHGPIPADAIREVIPVAAAERAPDLVRGTHFGFVAFRGMTLLDLVGVHDAIARIGRAKLDESARFSFASATEDVWEEHGARFDAGYVRPELADVDVLVVPGGLGTRTLVSDPVVIEWLATHPANRLKASVCTGALLLGAAGHLAGHRATTHASATGDLAKYGAVHEARRVVHDRARISGGGVTAAIDVGLHVVRTFHGEEAAAAIATQMEWRIGDEENRRG